MSNMFNDRTYQSYMNLKTSIVRTIKLFNRFRKEKANDFDSSIIFYRASNSSIEDRRHTAFGSRV